MSAGIGRAAASVADKQALRLRRFGLAALSYAIGAGLATVAWMFGKLSGAALLGAVAAFATVNIIVYVSIRSGANLRLADPSLTRVQIVVAITLLMYLVFHLQQGRSIALFGCFIIFLFGIFRLTVREFIGVTLYTLAAHALVINLLMVLRPQAIADVVIELLAWLALAALLPIFIVVGRQVHELRSRLRATRAHFISLTEMTSDFYWESDAVHRLTQRGIADTGVGGPSRFSPDAGLGMCRWDVPSLSPGAAGWSAHRADMDAHRSFRGFELSRMGADGTEKHTSLSGDPVFDSHGVFQGYRGVGADITRRKRTERALGDNAESMRLFAESVPAMTASWGTDLRCRFANIPFTRFFHLDREGTEGMHLRDLAGEGLYPEIEPHFRQVMRGVPVTYERTHQRLPDAPSFLEVKLIPQFGTQGEVLGCFEVTTDITQHRLAETRIRVVAHHDSLTGLPNKLLFGHRLDEVIALAHAEGRKFALLYLDLDRFKPVNDTMGHAAGDELLKDASRRIEAQVRATDMVARVGGDEFTVILPGISDRSKAKVVARKIAAALSLSFELGDRKQRVRIGGSVGVALYPADGADSTALLAAADAAMYRVKHGTPHT